MAGNKHSSTLDAVDRITASIMQAQSVLAALRADVGAPDGGTLTPETTLNLLAAADNLLDGALGAVSGISLATVG